MFNDILFIICILAALFKSSHHKERNDEHILVVDSYPICSGQFGKPQTAQRKTRWTHFLKI